VKDVMTICSFQREEDIGFVIVDLQNYRIKELEKINIG